MHLPGSSASAAGICLQCTHALHAQNSRYTRACFGRALVLEPLNSLLSLPLTHTHTHTHTRTSVFERGYAVTCVTTGLFGRPLASRSRAEERKREKCGNRRFHTFTSLGRGDQTFRTRLSKTLAHTQALARQRADLHGSCLVAAW
jgi:hypothetical protein